MRFNKLQRFIVSQKCYYLLIESRNIGVYSTAA